MCLTRILHIPSSLKLMRWLSPIQLAACSMYPPSKVRISRSLRGRGKFKTVLMFAQRVIASEALRHLIFAPLCPTW